MANKLRRQGSPTRFLMKSSQKSYTPPYPAEAEPSDTQTIDMQNSTSTTMRSKTMALAIASASTSLEPSPALPGYLRPCSPTEQYWATRALTAETLLAAKMDHQRELKELAYTQDVRRVRDLAGLRELYDLRTRQLEFVTGLAITCIGLLVAFVIYLLMTLPASKHNSSNWSSSPHLTIPVLSPFASVIENETSIIGTRTLVACFALSVALLYGLLRLWHTHQPRKHTRTPST